MPVEQALDKKRVECAISKLAVVSWVDEGGPSRVPQLNIVGGATLGPTRKLMSIVAVSRELSEASDAESVSI